tara:strand:+ start:46 stop:1515 length:1470 start_codon:yes stop_codon:yes gene_type:complete
MGFDWKAFAASFLEGQTEAIKERRKDAEDFEEEEKEKANRNAELVSQRNLLAQDAAQLGNAAMQLGATKKQVIAAMSSGALGMKEFYEKLLKAANQKGVKTLGPTDIESIIDMPEVFEVNPKYIDGTLLEFAQQSYGAKPTTSMPKVQMDQSDSVMRQLFGYGAMDQAKAKLTDPGFMGSMSIADVNQLARQADYKSLYGDLGVNFFDKEFYGPSAASKLLKDVTAAADKARTSSLAKQAADQAERDLTTAQAAGNMLDVTIEEARQAAIDEVVQDSVLPTIQMNVDMYGTTGLYEHTPSVNLINQLLGEDYLNDLRELDEEVNNTLSNTEPTSESTAEANEEAANLLSQPPTESVDDSEEPTQSNNQTETTETEAPDPEAQKEALLALTFTERPSVLDAGRKLWDRNLEGKVDPENGKVIIVPPRPPEGGEKTKTFVRRNQFGVRTGSKKVTEAEYWDATYGSTHDPVTGLPRGIDKLLNADPRLLED